jgi:hypothetical protein|tara:strand:- start:846 stop:1616 length:771 start_codon:yes stop_codon:yes gene_type:complete
MTIEPDSTQAIYVYGFVPSNRLAPAMLGVDDAHSLELHACDGLVAVVSLVLLVDFESFDSEDNSQYLAWLTPRACRHSAVIDKVMEQGAIYPLSFGTLFSSVNALELVMTQRSNDVSASLAHIADCQEWSLEVTVDRNQAVDNLLAEELSSGRISLPKASGRRHLEEQKLRRNLHTGLSDWMESTLHEIYESIQPMTRDACQRKLIDHKVMHWAFLIPQHAAPAFLPHIDKVATDYESFGFNFRLTGPWAAYSFAR